MQKMHLSTIMIFKIIKSRHIMPRIGLKEISGDKKKFIM